MIASCLVYDESEQVIDAGGTPATRVCFLAPDQCQIIDTWHTLGLRGTGSHDFTVTDAFVPEAHSFTYQSLKSLRVDRSMAFPHLLEANSAPSRWVWRGPHSRRRLNWPADYTRARVSRAISSSQDVR
jgi:hypothetical protein